MIQASAIVSPLQMQADFFLAQTSPLQIHGADLYHNEPFRAVLNNTLEKRERFLEKPGFKDQREEGPIHGSALEAFEAEVKAFGLPLDTVSMDPKDLPLLQKILNESGFSPDEIHHIMKSLTQGPLTMERIMAVIGTVRTGPRVNLSLPEAALPSFGRFLLELGLNPEQVKNIITELGQGGQFGSEVLRGLLLKHGQTNLKELNLSNVDLSNLKDLLASLGAQPKNLQHLWQQLEASKGRMSMEGFLALFKSLERPEPLGPGQMDCIRSLVHNLRLKHTFRIRTHFDRIISLLQSMGDDKIDPDSLKHNPALAILRAGTPSARAIMNGTEFPGSAAAQNTNNAAASGPEIQPGAIVSREGELWNRPELQVRLETAATTRLSDSVLRQIAEKIIYSSRNNLHRIMIQLEPKELGQLKINMIFKNNQLQAKIVTEHGFVKLALEEQLDQLKKTLEEQGLHVERFDVSFTRDQQDFAGKSETWSAFQNSSQAASNTGSTIEPAALEELEAALPEAVRDVNQVDLFA
ncbi:MAG: flagellar hook-length control protein FliK [Deltaproteobacteria bacterium]|nr:flagellar hook-length control protein FliK [Deltaproteobacteria bacterium]MBW2086634.1 flagellar hook-length control protein FliK [Deltaproteobacteria bacterium]